MNREKLQHGIRFLGLTLVAAVLLAGCGKGCEKKEIRKEEMVSLQMIPVESNVVVGMDWVKFESSPLGQKMKEGLPEDVKPFLEGLEGIVLGIKMEGVGKDPDQFVAVISGKFEQEALVQKIKTQAEKEGVEVGEEEYDGVKIISAPLDPDMGFTFIGDKVLAGKKTALKKSIDLTQNKGESVLKNKEVMDLIGGIDMGNMLWAVGLIPEGGVGGGTPGSPMGTLSGVKALDLVLDLSKELNMDLGIIAREAEEANEMMAMANSYKTLFGTTMAQKDPMMGKVFDSIKLEVKGNRLAVNVKLDEALMKEITQRANEKVAPLQEASPAATPPSESPAP